MATNCSGNVYSSSLERKLACRCRDAAALPQSVLFYCFPHVPRLIKFVWLIIDTLIIQTRGNQDVFVCYIAVYWFVCGGGVKGKEVR